MPHINLQKAQLDVQEKFKLWTGGCPATRNRHLTSHPSTHIYGTGYKSQSADNPATILEAEWSQLAKWWNALRPNGDFRLSWVESLSSGAGVMDLCCECYGCAAIASRGGSKKPNFVYHLKKVATAPLAVLMFQASSNDVDDSLQLDYKIEYLGDSKNGTLNSEGYARVVLPVGITVDDCRIGFQGLGPGSFKLGMPGLLPGGRYMVQITSAWKQ